MILKNIHQAAATVDQEHRRNTVVHQTNLAKLTVGIVIRTVSATEVSFVEEIIVGPCSRGGLLIVAAPQPQRVPQVVGVSNV